MATRKPLVRISGKTKELPAADGIAGVPKLYPVTIRNCSDTGSLVDVIEASIPTDDWADGQIIDIDWVAMFRNTTGGARTLLIRIYFGSSYIELSAADSVGSGLAQIPYRIQLWRFGSDIWVPGWDYSYGFSAKWHGGAINAVSGSDQFSSGKRGGILTAQTFNTTKALKVAVQFNAAGTGQYYTVKGAVICKK